MVDIIDILLVFSFTVSRKNLQHYQLVPLHRSIERFLEVNEIMKELLMMFNICSISEICLFLFIHLAWAINQATCSSRFLHKYCSVIWEAIKWICAKEAAGRQAIF